MTAICRFVLELSELTTRPARQVTKVIAQLQQTESGTSHPIQEAAKAIARLKAEAASRFDEFLILRCEAPNEPPYDFAWIDEKSTSRNTARPRYTSAANTTIRRPGLVNTVSKSVTARRYLDHNIVAHLPRLENAGLFREYLSALFDCA